MDKTLRFPDYILSKMAPAAGEGGGGGGDGGLGAKAEAAEAAGGGGAAAAGAPRRPRFSAKAARRWLHQNLLLLLTVAGVVLGVTAGFSLRPLQLGLDAVMLVAYPGELVMRLLKLMILPLIIASLIAGSARLNASMNGKIAARTLLYFALTSLLNAILGTALVLAIHPGNPATKSALGVGTEDRQAHILDSFLDLGRNVFPDNLFQAAFQQAHTVYTPKISAPPYNGSINGTGAVLMASAAAAGADTAGGGSGEEALEETVVTHTELVRTIKYREGTNTLGVIFFCLVFGTVLGTMGRKAEVVIEFFTTVDEVIMRIVTGIMWLTPVGVASVIAGKILSVEDLSVVVQQLGWFVFTVVLGVFIYQLIIMQLIYFIIIRRNPYKYYWGLAQATLTAFATASTAAALPVTLRCMDEKVRVDQRISRFILPIGCTINMDGTALFVAVASIFIAQMNQISLGIGEILTVCLASTAASFSSASVPSAALVLIFMVLSTIDAPVQDVSLLFAIDWFVDRVRTTNNMLGDCYAAAVVEHLSKKQLQASNSSIFPPDRVLIQNNHLLPVHLSDCGEKTVEPEIIVVEVQAHLKNGNVRNL
ncbi:excitatory amino acid transporter isoform X1 [Schistocerca serialis cubense]|uniref:excitatory amino acid transporter isoform X1 n=2 Tax=Schistocerca cancellata TaxID=274614 RepID=UPI0021196F3F|nr:excitatory amino acid transporter isoform X1 [Schistocerca cancellata]XP_049940052.1 excitatory amino acid transporter isoform X1 [Schistocerca serialis cubense]